jgi:hypothetical protein
MIIEFNNAYQLETVLTKVDVVQDLYQLTLTKKDLVENTTTSDEHFFTMKQLKEFVIYLNKATNDYI